MKNLFIGLIATGFMTLSSFTTISSSKNDKLEEMVGYSCCTAFNSSHTQSVTVCGDRPNNCKLALELYHVIF